MKRPDTILCQTLIQASLALVLAASGAWALVSRDTLRAIPTLARLSFWVPPPRMKEFEAVYKAEVLPILKRHGLVESSERGRATPDAIFSRLFELKTPSEAEERERALQGDPAFRALLRKLGPRFGTARQDSLIECRFRLYATPAVGRVVPAGPGKKTPAGPGKGVWRTFDKESGLGQSFPMRILQDREGFLWIGTTGGGVVRFDGQTFTAFRTAQGLVDNTVISTFQDREGTLWFGTYGGVSRFDGRRFTNFTIKNGLAHNNVQAIVQDREGTLWFGTRGGGVSRFDGNVWTTFTTKDGLAHNSVMAICQDREGVLWFGTEGGGVSRYALSAAPAQPDGKRFSTLTTKDGLAHNSVCSITQDRQGDLWFGTMGGGVSRYDGRSFVTYNTRNGLLDDRISAVFQDREGSLWFCNLLGGVSRLNGHTPSTGLGGGFTSFTTDDGLAGPVVEGMMQDMEGHLWFGAMGGLSQYYGRAITNFSVRDGLPGNDVPAIIQDREGALWFATYGGVSRYDGRTFLTFTTQDGLADNQVRTAFQDREGNLWFGTINGGVSRYDGKTFTSFTKHEGLADNEVSAIVQEQDGSLWFGTANGLTRLDARTLSTFTEEDGMADNRAKNVFLDRKGHLWLSGGWQGIYGKGVSRYDGHRFTTFTVRDGLGHNGVEGIVEDREGHLWFGTVNGASRYDGKAFVTFTTEDGLAGNGIYSIFEDREGHLWFGTYGDGISRYDGRTFQTLTTRDGLPLNGAQAFFQDREGSLWLGTIGVTRLRPQPPSPPTVAIHAVVADLRYPGTDDLSIPSSVRRVAFEFRGGMSFKTRLEGMVYRYRLKGYDQDWMTTRNRQVTYQDLPRGDYTFEVVAVDRDLVYSKKPATVTLRVHPPYGILALAGGLALSLAAAAVTGGYAIRRRRDLRRAERALMQEMEKELQTAHEMQMALMPKESPRFEGFDIAGRCIPANHVGGDIFQYFRLPENRLALVMVDVTGHAMEAAIPVVMFSGILKSHMELGGSLSDRFNRLNQAMHGTLTGRTLVCLAMGELDLAGHSFSLSNSGCPYPYHFQPVTGEVVELQVDAYPLGVRLDTEYPVVQVQLSAGDCLIFCSDGIAEVVNGAGEQFGYERTTEVIRGACVEGLSAEATIDRIIGSVNAFRGDASQADDMTCVVLRVEGVGIGA